MSTFRDRILTATALALMLSPTAAWAQGPTIIDSFDTGRQNELTLRSQLTPQVRDGGKGGTMLGGWRTTNWTVVADTALPDPMTGRDATFGVGDGRLVIENGIDVAYTLELYYGFDQHGDSAPLNEDASGFAEGGHFAVSFHSVDTLVQVLVVLYTNDGADNFSAAVPVAPSAIPYTLNIPLSTFESGFTELPPTPGDLVDVDRIDLVFESGGQGSDFALDQIAFTE